MPQTFGRKKKGRYKIPYKSYDPDRRRMRYAGHVAYKVENRNAYKVLVFGKPEGKRLRCRPRHRMEENINMGLK